FLLAVDFFFAAARFLGTFAPARRASDRPMAIACLRLVTFLPERPLRNVPRLRSLMAFSTFFDAFLPYRGGMSGRLGACVVATLRRTAVCPSLGASIGRDRPDWRASGYRKMRPQRYSKTASRCACQEASSGLSKAS